MKYTKEQMQDMAYGYGESDKLIEVEKKITSVSRWSIHYTVIFKDVDTGKHYSSSYSRGATEAQDESPYEYANDEIEVTEVEQIEKMVMVWEKVK